MKRFFVTLVALVVALMTAEAQGLGQLYDDGRVRGIVVKLAPDGQPAVLMSIESCKERFSEVEQYNGQLPAYDRNDGRVNMAAIEQYIAQYGGSFPTYEWCRSLGPGWYLPSINETYDAWIVGWAGGEATDTYDQTRFLAMNDIVKRNGGDKMTVTGDNMPLGMTSSTIFTIDHPKKGEQNMLYYVAIKESAGSMVGNAFVPSMAKTFGARTPKGGKVEVLPGNVGAKAGVVYATHAFYRLREDAYAGGIYEAPAVNGKLFGNPGRASATRLTAVPETKTPTPAAAPAPQSPAPQQPAPQKYENRPEMRSVKVERDEAAARQAAATPAPQTAPAPAQQPVVYANNSGWDIIVAPGQDIQCRVLRVGEKEIEYKKAGFENGPTYTISRRKAEKIIYANGLVEEVKTSVLDFIKKK